MARQRTPLAKAEATGCTLHDPKPFKSRREPKTGGPLGGPPKWMKNKSQLEAWRTFDGELPWLNQSHRGLVGIASEIRGKTSTQSTACHLTSRRVFLDDLVSEETQRVSKQLHDLMMWNGHVAVGGTGRVGGAQLVVGHGTGARMQYGGIAGS